MHIPTLPHTSYCNQPDIHTHRTPIYTHSHTHLHKPTGTYTCQHIHTHTHLKWVFIGFVTVPLIVTRFYSGSQGSLLFCFFPPYLYPPLLSHLLLSLCVCVCVCGCSNGVCSGKAHLQIINSSTSAISSWSPLCFCARLLPPIWWIHHYSIIPDFFLVL